MPILVAKLNVYALLLNDDPQKKLCHKTYFLVSCDFVMQIQNKMEYGVKKVR